MGYYTRFTFSVHNYGSNVTNEQEKEAKNKEIIDKIMELFETNDECMYPIADAINDYGEEQYLSGTLSIDSDEPAKWYENTSDMKKLSKCFPDVIFCLHGEGEENDDIWNEYYQNDKACAYKAEIVIPPFNPSDLK